MKGLSTVYISTVFSLEPSRQINAQLSSGIKTSHILEGAVQLFHNYNMEKEKY